MIEFGEINCWRCINDADFNVDVNVAECAWAYRGDADRKHSFKGFWRPQRREVVFRCFVHYDELEIIREDGQPVCSGRHGGSLTTMISRTQDSRVWNSRPDVSFRETSRPAAFVSRPSAALRC